MKHWRTHRQLSRKKPKPQLPFEVVDTAVAFPTTTVRAASTVRMQVAPQHIFRGDRLYIQADHAEDLEILTLMVGNYHVGGIEPLPVKPFTVERCADGTFGVAFGMPTSEIGNLITLAIKNHGPHTTDVRAVIFGRAPRGCYGGRSDSFSRMDGWPR